MVSIKVEKLTKSFGDFTAVNDVSFSIGKGEVFGLLGPNGAGKTTTISMLATLLPATSGKAEIEGKSITSDQDGVRKSIGIVFQDQSLDDELTAYENMDLHGRLYRMEGKLRKERALELLKLVELEGRKDDLVKTFSGGMRRRLEIARGLLHRPKVLFLDEPTLGLDPQTRNKLWEYIAQLNEAQKITVILTTHYMEEADRLCNRIAIIDRGKIIAVGTPSELKEGIGGDVITVKSENPEGVYARLSKEKWVKRIEKHDGSVTVNLANAEKHIAGMVKMLDGLEISTLSVHKPTLEDVFLHFTGRTIREEEAGAKEEMRMRHRVWSRG
ncbi:ATP-binding cassette domain-containing protein [Candidatus Micrarchaeota archaeon]|nr:ATP-binding cassette domain-containing protein [Candidatus Micrarchaeota archaeon]